MFSSIKRALTWDNDFERSWDKDRFRNWLDDSSVFERRGDFGGWGRQLEGAKAMHKRRGKASGKSPQLAAYEGFREVANAFYATYQDHPNMNVHWMLMAHGLYHCASGIFEEGYDPKGRLGDLWRPHYEKYEAEEAAEKKRLEEVLSHTFKWPEINEARSGLQGGNIPDTAERIWLHIPPENEPHTAHEIAKRALVSIRDFVFWSVVFREHGILKERADRHPYLRSKRHVYSRWYDDLRDNLAKAACSPLRELHADGKWKDHVQKFERF